MIKRRTELQKLIKALYDGTIENKIHKDIDLRSDNLIVLGHDIGADAVMAHENSLIKGVIAIEPTLFPQQIP